MTRSVFRDPRWAMSSCTRCSTRFIQVRNMETVVQRASHGLHPNKQVSVCRNAIDTKGKWQIEKTKEKPTCLIFI